jgi:rhodanese-related sulfurtransferase
MTSTTVTPRYKVGVGELSQEISSGTTVVDVRTTSEFRAGHIPGSLNVPMDEIESRLEDVPKGRPVVLVCASGNRAEITRGLLAGRLGETVCLEGGFEAWERAGLPVVHSTRTRLALDRQAMIGASALLFAAVGLGTFVAPGWYLLALVPAVGLMTAGTTGFCLMGVILSAMPWNRAR